MTNQVQESTLPVSPTPEPTGAGGAASGSATSPDIGAVLARLEKAEQELRGLQSIGDKREAKISEQFSIVKDYLQRANIKLDERVIREMQVDEILAQRGQQTPPQGNGGPLPTPQPSVDYLKVFTAVGVDPANNEVIQLAIQHSRNMKDLSAALVDWKITKSQQPAANASAVAPAPGGVSAASDDQKATNLMNELAVLSRNPSPNIKRIQELNKELRQLTG